jgi:hypothetical protein
MVADDEMSMVHLCRAIKDQRALVVALVDDDAALPREVMRLSRMQNEWKRRMHEAASGSGQDAGVPAGGPDLSGERDPGPAGEMKGARL